MSNAQFSQESLIFKFLGSQEFIDTLIQKNLEPETHNLLLSAHLLTIGFNTTGISEGGVNVDYSHKVAPVNEDFARASSKFHFYTTANALIEESNRCTHSRISLNNNYFRTNYAIFFRDFCIEYFNKYSKTLDLESFNARFDNSKNNLSSEINFRLIKKKRFSEEGQKYGYESIVTRNKIVKSYVENWYLEKELGLNQDTNQKKKFKL